MRAIINRLRRLEYAAIPAERDRAAVAAILEARRRLGPDYIEPTPFPPDRFTGRRTMADRIVRARMLSRERAGLIGGKA